jgi:hypothetical protein
VGTVVARWVTTEDADFYQQKITRTSHDMMKTSVEAVAIRKSSGKAVQLNSKRLY